MMPESNVKINIIGHRPQSDSHVIVKLDCENFKDFYNPIEILFWYI